MISFEISSILHLSDSEVDDIANALALQPMSDIIIEWCRYIQETSLNKIDIKILRLKRNGTFLGIGILTVIPNLMVTNLLPESLKKYGKLFDRFHLNPFFFNIGVLNIPLIHRPGLLTVPGINPDEYLQLYLELALFLRKNKLGMHALFICTDPDCGADQLFSQNRWARRPFDFRTTLDYPYKSFDEYYATLSRGIRYDIRRGKQMLAQWGGKIDLCSDFETLAPVITELFKKTAEPKGGVRLIEIGENFFSEMSRLKRSAPQWLLVRTPEKVVAFFQLFQSGKTLFIKYCGLDYDLSYKMWAYFNLYYAAMEYALAHDLTEIDCGLTNNFFKEHKLNCRLIPVTYWIDFYHPLLIPVKVLMRLVF